MDILEAIYQRRSVRNYTEQQLDKETINTLLKATVQAPSAANSQPWAFVTIQDSSLLKDYSDLAKAHLLNHISQHSPLAKYRAALSNPDFNIFYNAPTLIVIYAKPDSPCPVEDGSLAAQNLMLAAHSMSLGTCWIGFATSLLNQLEHKQQWNVPQEYTAIAPIVVGYPASPSPVLVKKDPEILNWK